MRNANPETQSYGDIMSRYGTAIYHSELKHHGILGMKWGIRRYQNEDGSLTEAGKRRYINSHGTLRSSAYGSLLGPQIDTSKYYDYVRKQTALKEKNAKKLSSKEKSSFTNKAINSIEKTIKGYGDNAFGWEDVWWYVEDNANDLSSMEKNVLTYDIIEGLKKKGYYNYD